MVLSFEAGSGGAIALPSMQRILMTALASLSLNFRIAYPFNSKEASVVLTG